MVKPRIAAGTAIAVTSSKPVSTAIREAMERAVHQAIQEGRDVDPVYLKAKMLAVAKETKESHGNTLAEIEMRVKARYPGHRPVHEAVDYAMRACIFEGIFDEHVIETRLIDAAKKAAVG